MGIKRGYLRYTFNIYFETFFRNNIFLKSFFKNFFDFIFIFALWLISHGYSDYIKIAV
jgi:hypothetical protein